MDDASVAGGSPRAAATRAPCTLTLKLAVLPGLQLTLYTTKGRKGLLHPSFGVNPILTMLRMLGEIHAIIGGNYH